MTSMIRIVQTCGSLLNDPGTIRRFLSKAPTTREAHRPRAQSRPVKKVFSSDGVELGSVQTRLEDSVQAQKVAERAERRTGSRPGSRVGRLAGSAPAASRTESKEIAKEKTKREVVAEFSDREDLVPLGEVEEEDKLPPGLDWKDLPRFVRIFGWEKDSKHLRKLKNSLSHHHKKDDNVVLEGKRLIVDAMKEGFYPSIFVFSRLNLLSGFPFDRSKDLAMYQIPYRNLQAWSEMKTQPGFMGAFSRHEIEMSVAAKFHADTLPITVILDNVRNPENLGSILRVSAAVGCKRVITMQGCVDPWQAKVLRAAAGAHFHLPIIRDVPWDSLHRHVPKLPQVILADIVRGDEVSERVHIPEQVLSQRLSELEERCKEFQFQADYEKPPGIDTLADKEEKEVLESLREYHTNPDNLHAGYRDFSYYDEDLLSEYTSLPLVSKMYHEFKCFGPKQELVVVVGGETEGISERAKKFTHSHLGERLYIPLRSKIDSLNVVSATSVILFEIQKSLLTVG